MMRRRQYEEIDSKCIVPTIKQGNSFVMCCGCFTKKGVGKLCILDHAMGRFYYWQILEENLLSSMEQLGLGTNFILICDNDPKHTSILIKN